MSIAESFTPENDAGYFAWDESYAATDAAGSQLAGYARKLREGLFNELSLEDQKKELVLYGVIGESERVGKYSLEVQLCIGTGWGSKSYPRQETTVRNKHEFNR